MDGHWLWMDAIMRQLPSTASARYDFKQDSILRPGYGRDK